MYPELVGRLGRRRSILLRDYLAVKAVIVVIDDPIILECLLTIDMQEKIKSFG